MPLAVRTASATEAAALVASDRGARLLGGGTLLMRAVNEGDVAITTLVRVAERAMSELTLSSRIVLGAQITLARVLRERDLAFLHPVARSIAGPAVRTAATVGGNLFAPPPYGDFAAALLALDATVSVTTGYGARDVPLDEFLTARDRPGLVLSVAFDRPQDGAFRWRKVSRVKPKGASVLSIAAHLPVRGGRIAGARIAYGAMAPTAIRARAAERALDGRALDEPGIAAALAAAIEGTSPATDALASAWYRREVLPVHLRRLLLGRET